jgi:hypothetical protein
VEYNGDFAIKFTKQKKVEKLLSECSDNEKSKNDIVEKDGNIFVNIPKEKIVK